MAAVIMPAGLGLVQRERLAFIDFRLFFLGSVSRADIVGRFGVSPAVSTRDLALYRDVARSNISFDGSSKSYRIGPAFSPLFEHPLDRVLLALSKGFGDGLGGIPPVVLCEIAEPINKPVQRTLAAVTRAIASGAALSISYFSVSGGESKREILPFALADNGLRWHVRAFDRKSSSFRDFVLSRISNPLALSGMGPDEGERPEDDGEWNATIDLDVVAHPDSARPEIAAFDFPMENGVLRLRARAALAGYVLRRWGIDCSPNHFLDPVTHPLWLRNHRVLEGVSSGAIAPGRTAANGGSE